MEFIKGHARSSDYGSYSGLSHYQCGVLGSGIRAQGS